MAESSPDQILYRLKSRGPQTTAGIARHLDQSTVGARKHLTRLEADGLIEADDRVVGVGRPKRHWTLTDAGHARFPDAHSDLTLELLTSAKEVFGEDGVDKLIRDRERKSLAAYQKALAPYRSLAGKVKKLAEIRAHEGYMAEWEKRGPNDYLLIENHCPICAAARECQNLCRSELAIFATALGPDVAIQREEHLLTGARRCAYRIRPAHTETETRL